VLLQDLGAKDQTADSEILNNESVKFLSSLTREFRQRLTSLLHRRNLRQDFYDKGHIPNFLSETRDVRESDWSISDIPKNLQDRRVEITGPPDRKMIINALNSGANVYMADFEDSLSPTWKNVLDGHTNLIDAVRKTITYDHPSKGTYSLNDDTACLFVRPRGLHLNESHISIDSKPIPAALFDFGMFLFHNGKFLSDSGEGPYFYIPKIEHYLEARWWNDVFTWSQEELGIPLGTIKATVLIETLPAAFQMDEILYELRDHSAGLNCGRWDYIFSYIKTLKNHSNKVLPDRDEVTMNTNFMNTYSKLLVRTCHRRGAHAMGGMAAQIPIKNDPEANIRALNRVRGDKIREVNLGHDGTWVAHPGLVYIAKNVFDEYMPQKNNIDKQIEFECSRDDLINPPPGNITEKCLRKNINISIHYIASWLSGNGCVPLYNVMEDTATAEISRAQTWQWLKHNKFSQMRFNEIFVEEVNKIRDEIGDLTFENSNYEGASNMFETLSNSNEFENFLTLSAYELIS